VISLELNLENFLFTLFILGASIYMMQNLRMQLARANRRQETQKISNEELLSFPILIMAFSALALVLLFIGTLKP